jgi:hypothetical protein
MPPPWVNKVTIKEKQIVLTVLADEFREGENIEISGSATQTSGGFAVFDVIQPVPKASPDNTVNMYVTITPSRPFTKGEAVTVVMRAGPVWVSVLEEPLTGSVPTRRAPKPSASAEDGTTWILTSAAYAEPSTGGDDDQAATGSEDNFQGD